MSKILKLFIRILKGNRILSNILMVSGGTLFAQIFAIITTPVITRIYTTEEYGILTTFNSVLSILGIAGALKFELAIPIADDEKSAFQCFIISILALFFTTFIIFSGLFVGGREVLEYLGAENLYNYCWVIPIGIFLVQYFAIVIQYSYRERNFKRISGTTIKQSIIGNTAKILFGLLNIGPIGLLLSRIMSDSVGAFSLTKSIAFSESKELTKESLIRTAKRYKRFPLFQLPSTIIGQVALNLPVFYIGKIYDSSTIGSFGLANTVVNLSMDLVGKSVGNVFYSEAAKLAKTNPVELKSLSNSIIKKMTILGLVPLIFLLFGGKMFFRIAFGSQWEISGTFASILSIGIFFSFVLSPISRVYEVYEKQVCGLILNCLNLAMTALFFGVAQYMNLTVYTTLAGYTIIKSILSVITFAYSRKFINASILESKTI